MGAAGPLFGVIFYLLVIIAAISSAISLMEVIAAYFIDKRAALGKSNDRTKIVLWVSVAILIEALLVAIDGLGANGVWVPFQKTLGVGTWNDCWLDFMDCWSEGIAMPLGAMLMALMVGWELKPDYLLDEIHSGESSKFFDGFYRVCIKWLVAPIMAFVFAGQMIDFFPVEPTILYAIAFGLLLIFFIYTLIGSKKTANSK